MSQTSRDRDNSRRVRTHEKNSGETVRRLGTIIQSIFCAQSGAGIRLNFWKWFGESRYPGALSPVLENFRRAFSPDPTDCPWVSEDEIFPEGRVKAVYRFYPFPFLAYLIHSSHTPISLYTDVVLFFCSFFWKTSAHARKHPCPVRWRSINPLRIIFYHTRSTDFEEKIEGL